MYFLKKRTVFLRLSGSGIFHYSQGYQASMFMPPSLQTYLHLSAPQPPRVGSLSAASSKSHFTSTALMVLLLEFSGNEHRNVLESRKPPLVFYGVVNRICPTEFIGVGKSASPYALGFAPVTPVHGNEKSRL